MDRVVRVAIQLEQRLVYPFEEADHIFTIMGFFKDAHADTAELGAALHQRLVAHQHGLTEQARIIQ